MERARLVRRSGTSVNRVVIGATLATIGYLLSPLSWWNDALVNVPIAFAIAYVLHSLVGLNKFIGFYIGYLLSNIAGMIMLIYGGYLVYSRGSRHGWRSILKSIAISAIYTFAASIILRFLGLLG